MSAVIRPALPVMALALAMVAAGVAGYLVWRWQQPPATVEGVVAAGCDLHRGPCRAAFPGGGSFEISATPQPLPLLKPITVEVRLHGLSADSVEIDLTSPDMPMGYNRRRLFPAGGHFAGRTLLPVCTVRDRMAWRLRVIAHTPDNMRSAHFDFVTAAGRDRPD
jgi:hypothetical protein